MKRPKTRLQKETQQNQNQKQQRSPNHAFCPLTVLRKLHHYPISFLAMLDKGALSGSQSLEVFCPGYATTQDSDFDVYQLADPYAMIDVMHTLRFAPVRWNNFLTTYLTQVNECGVAIVPYLVFVDLAQKLETPPDVLDAFLRSRYSDPIYFDFFARFNAAYSACWLKLESLSKKPDNQIFTGEGLVPEDLVQLFEVHARDRVWVCTAFISEFHDVPKAITSLLQHHKDNALERALKRAKVAWKNMGWPETLLAGYIRSRFISSENNVGDVKFKMSRIFGPSDATDEFGDAYHGRTTAKQADEQEFHILRGKLATNTEIQLMLVPERKHSVFHTCLGFYATHPMSLITCTQGAHLYYDSARQHISYEVDVSGVEWKHSRAPAAKEKWQKRGWTFEPLHKELNLRTGGDRRVARIDYESIYRSAMQEGITLPDWWDTYFKTRKQAFQASSWIEQEGRIVNTSYPHQYVSQDGNLLQWVQENLTDHDDVIPKKLWNDREAIAWTQLDLWFGGIRALAQRMSYIIEV